MYGWKLTKLIWECAQLAPRLLTYGSELPIFDCLNDPPASVNWFCSVRAPSEFIGNVIALFWLSLFNKRPILWVGSFCPYFESLRLRCIRWAFCVFRKPSSKSRSCCANWLLNCCCTPATSWGNVAWSNWWFVANVSTVLIMEHSSGGRGPPPMRTAPALRVISLGVDVDSLRPSLPVVPDRNR